MTYTHLLFDLDHTLLYFDCAEDLALTFLLEEAGVASQEIKVYKDHYIPMNRAMGGKTSTMICLQSLNYFARAFHVSLSTLEKK